ncbi:MAG: VOC family protein [Prolixibacteraceae bacterium]
MKQLLPLLFCLLVMNSFAPATKEVFQINKDTGSAKLTTSASNDETSQSPITKPLCAKILGIAHLAYYSNNFEKEKQFYGEYLGLNSYPSRFDKNGVEDMIKYRFGNKQSVELFIEKKSDDRRFYHYAVMVDNSEQMRQYLASKGLKVPKDSIKNKSNYFAYDFNNMICEIVDIRKFGPDKKDAQLPGIASHIDCVGFVVPDMEKALKFYVEVLGCKEINRKIEKNILKVMVQLQDSPDKIELIEYQQKDASPDYGFYDYYSILVPSVTNAITQLKNNKLKDGSEINIQKLNVKKGKQIELFDLNGTRILLHEL